MDKEEAELIAKNCLTTFLDTQRKLETEGHSETSTSLSMSLVALIYSAYEVSSRAILRKDIIKVMDQIGTDVYEDVNDLYNKLTEQTEKE